MAKKKGIKVEAQKIQMMAVDELIPYVRNPKAHPAKQVNKIARLIKEVGFQGAILIDKGKEIVAGHGRLLAAKKLGLEKVPVIIDEDLTPEQVSMFRIADNKVAESDWIEEYLKQEITEIDASLLDSELTGFDFEELDKLIYNQGNEVERGKQKKSIESIDEAFEIVVMNLTEKSQVKLLGRLSKEGYECKAYVS
ncbi:MAG: ParB N-terminal domain-containing protein [Deltaproteobacteria bacterium]|nr:ParB N-terminal domain-containing protein [Deltaproteobacteria bacterium]